MMTPIMSNEYRYLYQLITIKIYYCWTTLVVLEVR